MKKGFTIKGVRFEVLSRAELWALLAVETTKKQARQILRRNKAVLKHLEGPRKRFEAERWDLGCPHCEAVDDDCDVCAWGKSGVFCGKDDNCRPLEACLSAAFGGYDHSDVGDFVHLMRDAIGWYGDELEECVLSELHHGEPLSRASEALLNEYLDPCRAFLIGHIEWATAIIAGIRPEDVEKSINRYMRRRHGKCAKKKVAKKKS